MIGFHDGINNAEDCVFIRDEADNIIIKLMYALNADRTARTGELSANYYFYAALDPRQPEQKHIVGIVKVKYVDKGAGLIPEPASN